MKSRLLCAVSLASFAIATPAFGQILDNEIIVTAQKREQNIDDVSIAITAASGETLRDLGLTSTRDMDSLTSNIDIKYSGLGDANPVVTIRGVGMDSYNNFHGAGVGLYVDEVFLSSSAFASLFTFDMGRVEILKGPQGTLYGRNTTGGAINFVTAEPTDHLDGYVQLTGGNFGTIKTEGAISGPLSDNVRARLSGAFERQKSFFTDTVSGNRLRSSRNFGIRGRIAADAGDATLDLSAFYGERSGSPGGLKTFGTADPAFTLMPCAAAATTFASARGVGVAGLDPATCSDATGFSDLDPDQYNIAIDPSLSPNYRLKSKTYGATLNVQVPTPIGEFTSVTGYLYSDRFFIEVFGTTPNGGGFPLGGFGPALQGEHYDTNEQFSQEIRFAGDVGDLDYIIGGYYSYDKANAISPFRSTGLFTPVLALPDPDGLGVTLDPFYLDYTQKTRVAAVFVNLDYAVSDTVTLIGGLRYNYEKLKFNGISQAFLAGPLMTTDDVFNATDAERAAQAITLAELSNSLDFNNVTGKLAIEARPADDLLLYASFSTAFKSGGYVADFAFSPDDLTTFDEEKMKAFEVGIKAGFADDRLRINAAGFYYDYKNIQTLVPSSNGLTFSFDNIDGKAEIYGLDLELHASPFEGLSALFSLGYVHGRLKSDAQPIFDGNRLANNPTWQGTGLVRYERPVSENLLGSIQFDFKTSSGKFTESLNNPANYARGYTTVNARVALGSEDGRWEIAGWVQNLTDKAVQEEVLFADLLSVVGVLYGAPRTFGGTLTYNFW